MEELLCMSLVTDLVFEGPRSVPRGILIRHCSGSDLRPETCPLSPLGVLTTTYCNDFRKEKMVSD